MEDKNLAEMKVMPKIALGAWAWGNDGTFGGTLTPEALKPVFDTAMKEGLNLWETIIELSRETVI